MSEVGRDGGYSEILTAATATIGRLGAPAAAEQFGIDQILASTDAGVDEDLAIYAFLEAQGFHAGTSSVLSRFALVDVVRAGHEDLAEALYGDRTGVPNLVTVAGWSKDSRVAADRIGSGLAVSTIHSDHRPRAEADRGDDYLTTVKLGPDSESIVVPEPEMAHFRSAVQTRLRLGATAETLGVCTRLLADATDYARGRTQFGSRLVDLQSVQDMLAWAGTERHQLRALFDAVIALPPSSPSRDEAATVVKALAGRSARRITQHSLQATGGIGFTWEYQHHIFQRRALALDALAGSAAELGLQLGRAVRESGKLPDFVPL